MYEGGYWNTTGIARHVTVKALLPEMEKRGITVLTHGATGRGNDQVRFQLATNMLNPHVAVYAPWRDPDVPQGVRRQERDDTTSARRITYRLLRHTRNPTQPTPTSWGSHMKPDASNR